ncbi:cadherin-23-like [Bradysia coprophila]|uniref:cadherin-23-like n=1 Tax=Bradysia coprophila TaxID=38358 RepID=UPI00187D898E|nr:cadherin-23-like [Bradysia coprophila]XP_037029737.1 cadherin-23-like [Bradysia coprophila]
MMTQSRVVIILTVFSSVFSTVFGQAWVSPYFLDPNTTGIMFDQFVNSQRIRMLEELPRPIKLAIINYAGTGTPYIGDFIDFTGGAASIQMTVTRDNGEWAIFIENRQDYENPNQQSYEFVVGIRDDITAPTDIRILIRVMNIFDNDPTIIYDGPCKAKELHANYDTNCKFQVYDADGLLDNDIRIEIEGDYNETEHFEFRDPVDVDSYTREYTLFVTNEVRYVDRVLYNFKTHVYDIADNKGSVTTIVEIEDIPSEDPIWVTPFATLRFDEKTTQSKSVKAIDGDTGLNEPIHYRLAFHSGDYSEYVSVEETTGLIHISEIDRDALKQEVFPFHVIAYKWNNESWAITGEAVLIVDDVNDNYPEIEIVPDLIEFDENRYLTLALERFIINDIDLGIHATYDVSLLSSSGSLINYAEPFSVIPTRGYQESAFTISVINTAKLDFEDEEWQTFVIIIKSQEEEFTEHNRTFELNVKLKNWNDEFPIFNNTEYMIDVLETVEANEILTSIAATDRDIGDEVIHRIVGMTELLISREGTISTLRNDTFDYETQTQVLVQIQATDTLETYPGEKLNSAYAQLIINVIDVNDETPQIRMPRQSPSIEENSIGGVIVTDGIIATDPDTTADLEFSINWELSYATKSGQEANQTLYENCFIIEADKTDHNRVIGHLKVNPDFPIDIDYEEYEVLYLAIFVTDLNQVVNEGTADAVLTVRIEDVNDNEPMFILDTLNTLRSVVEEAASGTLIGTIFAQDIDGPEFNVFKYSIKPSSESTPDDLVEINEDNGVITVRDGAIIDCDGDPKIYDLVYTVTLNDSLWITEGEIRINIIDINNKYPFFGEFEVEVSIYENATTGDEIQIILTSDMDRDPPHNITHFMINFLQFPNLGRYFGIDELSGQLSVKLQGDAVLDRDNGEDTHDIHINIEDNYQGNGRTNQDSTMLRLILLDVNDNAPIMPELQPTISENAQIGDRIVTGFYAPDIDDPATPNAQVEYRIVSVAAGGDNAEQIPDASDIFEIRNYDLKYCDIVVKQLLKGFYGMWLVTIEAYDHGHEFTTQLQLKSEKTYQFVINPFNYMAPELVYPLSGKAHRLSYDNQQLNRPLLLADNTPVPMFEARDDDGGDFGKITFEIASYGGGDDASYFRIVEETRNKSQIYLQKPIEARFYQLNVRASDGGPRTSEWAMGVLFIFLDLTGEPFFDMPTFETNFTENVTGLAETQIIPEAVDPKNIGLENEDDKFMIYYFIDTEYRPDDARLFELDRVTRVLRLTTELDREEIDNHQIRIIATNNLNGPENAKESSLLQVFISVNDVNDNPPSFEQKLYGAGITPTDWLTKEILTVTANDPDLNDVIRYRIDDDGITAKGDYLGNVESTAFTLERDTGVLRLNFEVLAVMKGYFEFKIVAYDLENHEDVCDVKIFIIADSARVTFVLLNEKASVEHHRAYVAQTLSRFYEYECYIDDIQPHILNEQPQDGITNVRVHFINNSEAIEANVILSRSGDIAFITNLKTALLQESINLLDVPNSDYPDTVANMERIVRIILIVVAVILAALCCSLIVAYCIKTRSLNRQLKALSATDFGSTESNLNRREAPTTNVFSVEGSNPVLNNNDLDKGIFDNMSVISESSDDSDFVGLDNDPTFAPNKRESTNVAVVNGINGKLGNINLQDDFDNYMNESKKSSKNSDFGFSKF